MDLYDVSDIVSTSLDDLGVQLDTNNPSKQVLQDKSETYNDKPIVPQVRAGEFDEDVDETLTQIENAKYASVKDPITRDNFYQSTACDWKETKELLQDDPDYTSDSGSMYWYTEDGVYRTSNHWGFGVGSCDWTLNSNPELSHRDDEGLRTGFAKWTDFTHTDEKTFPQIVEMLTPKEAGLIGETDQDTEVYYDNYRSRQLEPKEDFVEDVTYPAGIETRLYTQCAAEGEGAQPTNVVNKVEENPVDNVSDKVVDPVSGQNGAPRNYGNKKPGATSFKNYAFELTTIEKIAEEMVVEADLESKMPYLMKDMEKSKWDKDRYEEIIDICNRMDPTGNKAVFTQWILRKHVLDEEPISGTDSLKYLQDFLDLKKSKKLQNADADINHYKSFADLKAKVDQVLEETGGYTSKRQEEHTKAEDGIKKLDQDGDIELFVVNTPEAAAKEFRNTEWCVKDPKFFDQYAETDKNFYYFKKGGQPYLLVHRQDYKDVEDNRPSDEILLDTRKLILRNNLSSINANISSFYIKNGFVEKSSNPEEYQKMVDNIINDGFGPHLLYDNIVTRDNDPENFNRLVERELGRAHGEGCLRLLKRHIITQEDTEGFNRAVNGTIEGMTHATGHLYDYIKNVPELYEKSVNSDIENGWTDYLIEEKYLTKEKNPDLYNKCIRKAISGRTYVGLDWIDKGFITKEDTPELFDIAITQALKDHNDEYILEKGWLTQEEIDSYKQQPSEETEQTSLDDTAKESAFEFTDINKLADFVQEFNRQDELTDEQKNKFVNHLPVEEVNKDLKDELKEDAKQTGKVITHIPKSLNYPYVEDEMAGNKLFYSDLDWMEMSDLSEM